MRRGSPRRSLPGRRGHARRRARPAPRAGREGRPGRPRPRSAREIAPPTPVESSTRCGKTTRVSSDDRDRDGAEEDGPPHGLERPSQTPPCAARSLPAPDTARRGAGRTTTANPRPRAITRLRVKLDSRRRRVDQPQRRAASRRPRRRPRERGGAPRRSHATPRATAGTARGRRSPARWQARSPSAWPRPRGPALLRPGSPPSGTRAAA